VYKKIIAILVLAKAGLVNNQIPDLKVRATKSKMKFFFLSIFLLYSILGYSQKAVTVNKSDSFYNKVLNDFKPHSYYISLKIKRSQYEGIAIIENGDLFYWFNNQKGINQEEYVIYMKDLLKNKKRLDLGDIDTNRWGFFSVSSNYMLLKEHSNKRIWDFINANFHPFGNELFVINDPTEQWRVINEFFQVGIASRTDDESGYLFLTKKI
jgi:hypothetical protein